MEQTWRWFGPNDRVTLRDAREAGAEGIVTALHEIPAGGVWPVEQIMRRQAEIEAARLRWRVVESLDVTETMKLRAPGWQRHVENFKQSLRNLATCGIRTVAYNWMPLFSWMRTHLHAPAPAGGFTTRFDATAFAAFDLYLLKRKGADTSGVKNRAVRRMRIFRRSRRKNVRSCRRRFCADCQAATAATLCRKCGIWWSNMQKWTNRVFAKTLLSFCD